MKKLLLALVPATLFAGTAQALDTAPIVTELGTAATDIGVIFGAMVVAIVALWVISKARQLLKA